MAGGRPVPIVVGVGDIKNRSQKVEDAIEPMQLMLKATINAIKDTGLSESEAKVLQSTIDSVSVVATWTWNYPDLPGLLSDNLGVKHAYKVLSGHSGNSPAKLFDEAARRISLSESKVAIVTGGEALASCELIPFRILGMEYTKIWTSGCLCSGSQDSSTWLDATKQECSYRRSV
jgi:hypothetical protein